MKNSNNSTIIVAILAVVIIGLDVFLYNRMKKKLASTGGTDGTGGTTTLSDDPDVNKSVEILNSDTTNYTFLGDGEYISYDTHGRTDPEGFLMAFRMALDKPPTLNKGDIIQIVADNFAEDEQNHVLLAVFETYDSAGSLPNGFVKFLVDTTTPQILFSDKAVDENGILIQYYGDKFKDKEGYAGTVCKLYKQNI